jgi:cation:H+ antiporter
MRYIIVLGILGLVTGLSELLSSYADGASTSYYLIISGLLVGIVIILSGCELFANGVECLGDRLDMSHATVGSLLAAVGTALPETIVPILALLFGHGTHGKEIAVGAILGAPFMLGTLAMFLLGVTVTVLKVFKRRPEATLDINAPVMKFEMIFFLITMGIVAALSFLKISLLNHLGGAGLLMLYGVFVFYALRHEPEEGEEFSEYFHFNTLLKCPKNLRWIIIQIMVGLIFIIFGAHLFVKYLTAFSIKTGIPSLILSLIITPVATELPEKFNSITWTIKGKDTMGVGNITGAMVFQSTIPVSIGLIFTDWMLSWKEFYNIFSSLAMAGLVLLYIKRKKNLPAPVLLAGGLFYLGYILLVI